MATFSIKDLMISTAIVAAGCGIIGVLINQGKGVVPFVASLALFMGAGGVVGTGIFRLWGRPRTGAVVGVLFQCALFPLLVILSRWWHTQ